MNCGPRSVLDRPIQPEISCQRFLRDASGVSLLELLTTLALIGIIITILQTPLAEMWGSFDRNAVRRDFGADLRRAQNEAMGSGVRVILSVFGDGNGYSVGRDLFPFNNSIDANQEIFRRQFPRGIILSGVQKIIFDPRGYLIDQFGQLNSEELSLQQDGAVFFSATVYPTGILGS